MSYRSDDPSALLKKLGGAVLGGGGGGHARDPAIGLAVPGFDQVDALAHPFLGLGGDEFVAALSGQLHVHILDVFREDHPHAGASEGVGVVGDVPLDLQDAGRPAAYRFDNPQQGENVILLLAHQAPGVFGEAEGGGEPRVFQDALVDGLQEVGVGVYQARKYGLSPAVDNLGVRELGDDFIGRAQGGDSAILNPDCGVVEDGVSRAYGDDGCVLDYCCGH